MIWNQNFHALAFAFMIKPFLFAHKPQDTPKYKCWTFHHISHKLFIIFSISLATTSCLDFKWKNHHLISNYIYIFLRKIYIVFIQYFSVQNKAQVITWLVGWGLEKNIKQEELFVFVFNEMKWKEEGKRLSCKKKKRYCKESSITMHKGKIL